MTRRRISLLSVPFATKTSRPAQFRRWRTPRGQLWVDVDHSREIQLRFLRRILLNQPVELGITMEAIDIRIRRYRVGGIMFLECFAQGIQSFLRFSKKRINLNLVVNVIKTCFINCTCLLDERLGLLRIPQ